MHASPTAFCLHCGKPCGSRACRWHSGEQKLPSVPARRRPGPSSGLRRGFGPISVQARVHSALLPTNLNTTTRAGPPCSRPHQQSAVLGLLHPHLFAPSDNRQSPLRRVRVIVNEPTAASSIRPHAHTGCSGSPAVLGAAGEGRRYPTALGACHHFADAPLPGRIDIVLLTPHYSTSPGREQENITPKMTASDRHHLGLKPDRAGWD